MRRPIRRQLRHRRRKGIVVRLTERDEMVLHAVERFRLARTSDLVRYAFPRVRPDTAAVRLRRLFDSRHLAVLPPRRGEENVYRLGPAGKQHLAGRGIEAGRVPRGGLEHHLGVVQAWVAIATLNDIKLERCLPDWELRGAFSVGELRIVPDMFMLVRIGSDLQAIAIEVDCGTESQGILHRKLEVYRSLWGRPPGLFGWERFGVVLACLAPSRRGLLANTLKKAWVVPHVLWIAAESPSSALRKLFEELEAPLWASPYSKGSHREASE